MTDRNKPNGNMSAPQLIALFADADRHPNALSYELNRCKADVLVALADGADPALAGHALDELERRQNAVARLLGDNPALAAAFGR